MSRIRERDVLIESAMRFAGVVVFPGIAHRLRWPTRLGPRGLVAYIAVNTLVAFALFNWVFPFLRRSHEEYERAKAQLADRLGREPTDVELGEYFRRTRVT